MENGCIAVILFCSSINSICSICSGQMKVVICEDVCCFFLPQLIIKSKHNSTLNVQRYDQG